jgi:hypothetical protein
VTARCDTAPLPPNEPVEPLRAIAPIERGEPVIDFGSADCFAAIFAANASHGMVAGRTFDRRSLMASAFAPFRACRRGEEPLGRLQITNEM